MNTTKNPSVIDKKQNADTSQKVAIKPRGVKCFVCHVDMENSPDLALDMSNYPIPLYVKIFNHFAKLLVIRDAQKRTVQLSEERVRQVLFCKRCHGQVHQLYRLSNSANKESEMTQEEIKHLINLLKFKFAFGKRKNAKIKHIVTAHADPSRYHINGYWHLRETEEECAKLMYKPKELNSVLAALDIPKLSANRGLYDESNYFVVPCELEVDEVVDIITNRDEEEDTDNSFGGFEDDDDDDDEDGDDDDDFGMMAHPGRLNPMELVQVNMGHEVSNFENHSMSEQAGAYFDPMGTPFFNVPVGEIKPPRKQILASRVGVSSKAPIIKTIIRDKSGDIKETGELLNPNPTKVQKMTRDDSESDDDDDTDRNVMVNEEDDPDEQETPCPICNKKYPSMKTMVGHLSVHRKPFCDLCRLYFQNEDIYKAHNASLHGPGKPMVCFVCQASFIKDRNKLLNHLRTHKHLNTFRCSVEGCGEAFQTKVESVGHLRKCPFLASGSSSMTFSSPPRPGSSSSSGDEGARKSKSSKSSHFPTDPDGDDDEPPFIIEEVEVETDESARSPRSSESGSGSDEGGVEMEEVEMDED